MKAKRIRPGNTEADPKTFGGVKVHRTVPDDLGVLSMSPREFDAFTQGYQSGYLAAMQVSDERQAEHEQALHHRAYLTVQAMAGQPTHAELTRQRNDCTRPDWAGAA